MNISILYIIGKLEVGGAEIHLLNISKKLSDKKINVNIFPLKRGGSLENKFVENGINIIGKNYTSLGKLGLLLSAISLIINLRKYKFNIIHFFLPEAYILGSVCSLFTSDIIRIMSRRSLSVYQNRFFLIGIIERILHKKMDVILGNSKAVCNELKEEGVPDNKLKLIYNGIDINRFKTPPNNKKTEEAEVVLLCVANLIPYKGHEDLLKALNIIKDDIKGKWRLLLAGRDDGQGENLANLAKEFKLNNNVSLLGVVNDVPELITNSDIGILCSHQEGFSNSVLEYMAGGLPMVVTNVGGNAEAVIDGVTGFVVEPRCPDKLGKAILQLTNNMELRTKMGAASEERIKTNFLVDSCANEYSQLYKELVING